MKEKLARFMIGRNGNDQLNLFLLAVDLVLLIAASLVKGAGGKLLYLLVFALLGYAYFRMFSRRRKTAPLVNSGSKYRYSTRLSSRV